MSLQLLIGRADVPRAGHAGEQDAEQGKASPCREWSWGGSGLVVLVLVIVGCWALDNGLWIRDAGLRGWVAILPGAALWCWASGRGGLGRGAAAATRRQVAAYKYLPGSEEEVGGLSSSLNEINGSEA